VQSKEGEEMNRDEYNELFHKVGLNRVAFKAVNDCDDEILVLVNAAIAAEREACAKVAEERLLDKANCTAEQMYEMMKKSIAEAIRARGAP
jgi:hypothetical protein